MLDHTANEQGEDRTVTADSTRELSITDLVSLEKLQRIQDSFAEATGVASVITDVEGRPITRPSNFCRLCRDIIRKTPKGLCNCMRSDAALGRKHPAGPLMQPCLSGGLWDGGASICVGDRHIANWLIGQVRNDELSTEKMMEYARDIGADEEEFRRALAEVTVMPTRQFAKVCETLFLFASQMSELAYKNLALRQSESNLKTTLDSIGDAVIATDPDGNITRMNPVAEKLTGWTLDEAKGRPLAEIFRLRDDGALSVEMGGSAVLIDRTEVERRVADSVSPIRDPSGRTLGTVLVFRDVDDQCRLEEQLRHSQKMDAVGQLAGGVAHDFNNMLSGIMGAAELLSRKIGADPSLIRLVDVILDATEKAAALTRQLLNFSRKERIEAVSVDVHEIIRAAAAILERSIDRSIRIVTDLGASVAVVTGDSSLLQSSLMNLGINARDAMPEGGELRISSRNVVLSERDCRLFADEVSPGSFLEIDVSDTGVGMPPEVRKRIFEPFFTTKEAGRGTGLGLAAVYAMIKSHRGAIHVYSEPGRGTLFKIYLPLSAGAPSVAGETAVVDGSPAVRPARILLVDDEALIRRLAEMILQELGHQVVTAEDGAAAVELFRREAGQVDLVILDMVMPKMNGRDAFFAIRKIDPAVSVLFSSGFTHHQGVGDLLSMPGVVGFIQKPYRASTLADAVANAVAGKKMP